MKSIPSVSEDEAGLKRLFKQFSFPGGIPSHASAECPGSIHEGGELGYSLSHAFGAVFDNPKLIGGVRHRRRRGRNGAARDRLAFEQISKSRRPTVRFCPSCILTATKSPTRRFWRASRARNWINCCAATAGRRISSRATSRWPCTRRWPGPSIASIEEIQAIQKEARVDGNTERPRWPMIVLASPKGWTGPKVIDGRANEGTFRSHQVPLTDPATNPAHLKQLEEWLRSYRPQELFDEQGRLKPELKALAPKGDRRMGSNPNANGGRLLRDLRLPDFTDYAVNVTKPGIAGIGDTHVLGRFLRDVARMNAEQRNFRIFGPDETLSNGLEALFEVTNRQWQAATAAERRIPCAYRPSHGNAERTPMRGLARGLLAHRAARLFNCYEAFIHIVDSMFNQHAKWLKVSARPAVAPQDRIAQLSVELPCLAAGPQWLHASRPGLSWITSSTKKPKSSACIYPPTPIVSCR